MKKKLNARFMLIAAIAIVATAACAIILFYSILIEQIFEDLKANAHVVALMGASDIAENENEQLAGDGLRITLVNEAGEVLYDSQEDEAGMENHKARPEIALAFSEGEGRGMRRSATSLKHSFYYATLLSERKRAACRKDKRQYLSSASAHDVFDRCGRGGCLCRLRLFCKASD